MCEDTDAPDAGSRNLVEAHMAQTLGETQAQRVLVLLVEGRDGEETEVLASSIGMPLDGALNHYGSLQQEVYHRKQAFSNQRC